MNELNEDKYSKGKSFMQIEPKKKLGHLFSSNFPIRATFQTLCTRATLFCIENFMKFDANYFKYINDDHITSLKANANADESWNFFFRF